MVKINMNEAELDDPDLAAKVVFLAKAVKDLFEWIKEHKERLKAKNTEHNSDQMLRRLKDALTKSAATVSGYHKELQIAVKHIDKTRTIHFGSRGDVAIDYGPSYGKAVQAKSCFSSSYTDVDEHIKKAALQLTGEKLRAETPLRTDRRVIDVSIKNAKNRWPQTDADKSTVKLEAILDRIKQNVKDYEAGKKGYNKFGELDKKIGDSVSLSPRTNLFISRPAPDAVDLVVKIRWDNAREVNMGTAAQDEKKPIERVTSITVRLQKNGIKVNAYLVYYTYLE